LKGLNLPICPSLLLVGPFTFDEFNVIRCLYKFPVIAMVCI
jgi:hypothetical protein